MATCRKCSALVSCCARCHVDTVLYLKGLFRIAYPSICIGNNHFLGYILLTTTGETDAFRLSI